MENILRNYPISKGTMVYVFNDQNNGQSFTGYYWKSTAIEIAYDMSSGKIILINSKCILPPTLFMSYGFELSLLYRVHFDIVDSLIEFKRCPKWNFINSVKNRIANSKYFENEKINDKKINILAFSINDNSNIYPYDISNYFILIIINNNLQNCIEQFVQEDNKVILIAEEHIEKTNSYLWYSFYSNVIPEVPIIYSSQLESLLPELSDFILKDYEVYNNIIVYGNIFLNQTLIICNKISNPYSNENIHFLVYNENLFQKIRKFLEQKKKSQNFKPDNFFKKVINNINSHKVKANTYVGILEAQSIGEPLAGDDTINGLKESIITYNKTELRAVEFYLKSENYKDSRERILSNAYDRFNLPVISGSVDGFPAAIPIDGGSYANLLTRKVHQVFTNTKERINEIVQFLVIIRTLKIYAKFRIVEMVI
ncbi:hypothetical protein U3516DRAFT_734866 [Neocallimastix sp. 'constans']